MELVTVGGLVALLMISFSNWRMIDRIEASMDDKLGKIETRLATVSEKVDNVATARAAPAPSQGPDPNKVYTVKTEGAPSKGPANAAVTIAEFSDFQ
jgi:hypothetical protein